MSETTTTSTAASPSLWTKIAGEIILVWGILETTPALKNLPDEYAPWVAGIGAVVRVIGEVMQRRGLKLGIENVEAVAEVAKERADVAAAKADIMAEATTLTAARVEQVAAVTADALDPHTETPADAVAVLRGVEAAPRGFEGGREGRTVK